MSSSMKRCIACSSITVVVVLLVLSLEAAVDAVRHVPDGADGAAIRLPSNNDGKRDHHQVTTVSSSAADDGDKKQQLRWCEDPVCVPATSYCFCPYNKQQQLWWCEHPLCVPGGDLCFCPYNHDDIRTTRMEKSGAKKNELAVQDSGAAPAPAPPCEHPFCIFIRGEPVCRCLDPPPTSN